MKKHLSLYLALILVGLLVLSACGSSSDDESETNTNENATNNTATGDNEETPVLQVVTEAAFAPISFMDAGKVVGFDMDILDAVMAEAGFEYELENVGWESMLASVQNGDKDLAIAGITISDDRKETYDFSVPYFESTHMIVHKDGVNVESAEDLNDLTIGVQTGTTGADAAEKVVGVNSPNISKFESNAMAFMELAAGNVETVVTDNIVVAEYVKNNPDANLKTVTDPDNFESEYYGIMFPKGGEYQAEISEALTTIIENGTYQEIYQEWFGEEANIDNLLNAAE